MLLRSFILLLLSASFQLTAAEPQVDSSQLPRVPPTPPEKVLDTFKVKPGFRIELVAAEPLIVSPVAMSFDEDGRLYVVEMRDYSERRPEHLGRIRLLEDTDGDGRFDKSTVFAEDLPWPTAVICWAGGVFVGATPDILWLKDTNGDGKAEEREVIFTGFASDYAPFATNKLNVQALMNSFNWSLENRIHGATSFSGGKVKLAETEFTRAWRSRVAAPRKSAVDPVSTAPDGKAAATLDLRGRDFSFDPRTLEMRPESGGGQHGMSFDNRGRKFVCSNSDHIQQIAYEDRYAARNPYFNMPSPRVSIAVDGPAAEVFRISPDEPWRVLRTQWRVAGLVPGPIEGGGRASGYFTGATGVTIYRGDAYGEEFLGDAFIGDAGSNLVHRKKLRPDGILLRAERPADEQKVEFLASTDNWFRPVQFANAPDGCLYIIDMYREVIEHPWSLPANLKKHLDLNSGNDRGRIYRIVPESFKQRPLPRLSKASTADLVKLLEHPNGWHRDMGARLLYERQDKPAISALIPTLAASTSPLGRLHALYALEGAGSLQQASLTIALEDQDDAVQEAAILLSEHLMSNPKGDLWQKLTSPLTIRGQAARLRLAFALGQTQAPERIRVLAQLADPRGSAKPDPWVQTAVLSSLREGAGNVFEELYGRNRSFNYRSGTDFILPLVRLIGSHGQPAEVNQVLDFVRGTIGERGGAVRPAGFVPDLDLSIVFALNDGVQSGGRQLKAIVGPAKLRPILVRAQSLAHDTHAAITNRARAISVIAMADYPDAASWLLPLLDANQPPPIQSAVLKVLGRFADPGLCSDLTSRWSALGPATRGEAMTLLLKRPERARELLSAIATGVVKQTELSIAQQTQLRSHRDTAIREQAVKVLGRTPTATRQSVVESFQPALALKGDPAHGQKIFQARCASCHKLGAEGHALGPDLATVKSGGKEKILIAILDPNREVAPNFFSYAIETKDGESLTGILASENAGSITLRMAGGAESVIVRANIASLQSQGRSLMPEGLEEGLKPQDLADLLEFIVVGP